MGYGHCAIYSSLQRTNLSVWLFSFMAMGQKKEDKKQITLLTRESEL